MHSSQRINLERQSRLREDAVAALSIFFSLANPAPPARLQLLSSGELKAELDFAVKELDWQFMLTLLAEAEAIFRTDFDLRRHSKSYDPLSTAFRQIAKDRGDRVRLDEDILESWKLHHHDMRPLVSG